MRYSTASALIAISSLTLLACSSFTNNNHGTFVSAALTPQERQETEARDPTNPNYCPDCLTKALVNHFPHACPPDLQPMQAISRPSGPTPTERRCICIAFLDLFWMKADCSAECSFVHDEDAMSGFLSAKSIPGCDQWVDLETMTEKEVEGFAKRDPDHTPEVFEQATPEEAVAADAEADSNAAVTEEEERKKNKDAGVKKEKVEGEQEQDGPKITITMENFIRNPDGSIPDYALAEMAAEAEAKAAAAAAADAGEAETEAKIKDEL
ncbi:hypothetical protein BGX29_009876 [Mortierella sp. GBA35]|nr:hypothetical protein BGX29_009876 [Mortierella sp. GBA35]KAF9098907.1 hypothetical protein BGX23_004721 [Mortierella sp. AD031]KAG0218021.1 hypothetical protein BGX33_008882 [Mortierella sp. NVP41]